MADADVVVEVVGVDVERAGRSVLRGLTFSVARGEVVGFVGHNGAGKSTTMRLLAGVLSPTRGVVHIGNQPATTRAARAQVGWLSEVPAVDDDLTVGEQLFFAAGLRGLSGTHASSVVAAALDRHALVPLADALVRTLSKGTKQRLGLAQALLGQPACVLLDEPTAGMDPGQVAATRATLREAASHAGVLVSTHIIAEVVATCDRVLVLRDGGIALSARVDALAQPEAALLAALHGTTASRIEAAGAA